MGSTPNFATAKLQLFLYIPNILAKKNAFLAKKTAFLTIWCAFCMFRS